MPIRVIALDLEGTLVHSALEPHPRPGLAAFLDRCRALAERVVLFTGVEETVARRVVERLAREGHVPGWFGAIEIVRWEGPHKDLAYVEGVAVEEVLLVDDMESWIVAGQRAQWVAIAAYDHRSAAAEDRELERIAALLAERCGT